MSSLFRSQRRHVCCHCGQPVVSGQARWCGDLEDRTWHYECAEKVGKTTPILPRPKLWGRIAAAHVGTFA
ncbi:hypothetical protein [Azospirillum sp. TSO22-1]|uniref:hypothetical protein n=1 Tax=Azospirillum sp. TSO22-1 TaxID=716789 RepID=UPI0011B43317|nr:hypothetical protein [Azospirillum sp. TSO22-1]